MAAFSYIRGVGLWVPDSVITQDELEAIEERWPKILHSDGGTWSQSADILLTGAGCIEHSGTTKYPKLGSRTITVKRLLIPFNAGTQWGATAIGSSFDYTFVTSSASGSLVTPDYRARFLMPALPAGTLSEFRFRLDAAAHGTMPANMPLITVVELTDEGAFSGPIASELDPSANVAAYGAAHDVPLPASGTTDRRLSVEVTNEWGANAAAGLKFSLVCEVDIVVTQLKPQ